MIKPHTYSEEEKDGRENTNHADNVDLFNLLKIILDRSISGNEAKKKAIQYSEEHRTDRAVVMTVAGATNSKIDYEAFGKGDGSMCTLFEEIARENETKGIEKGITGMVSVLKELNIPDATIIQKISEKFGLSGKEAGQYVNAAGGEGLHTHKNI